MCVRLGRTIIAAASYPTLIVVCEPRLARNEEGRRLMDERMALEGRRWRLQHMAGEALYIHSYNCVERTPSGRKGTPLVSPTGYKRAWGKAVSGIDGSHKSMDRCNGAQNEITESFKDDRLLL
ncbi:hypothetical protein BKA56DRAFT_47460 [Ilyonectria sp. MPI-CAGE-AT-0026]|nr:hypothetical protein BKA56DRAFT_47460 [Ilyonectria sp. MPI-CAGE-AT-0026]